MELKTCPLCGFNPRVVKNFGEYCISCFNDYCSCRTAWYTNLEEAEINWNRRQIMEDLKRCPFCGGKAVLCEDKKQYKIFCTNPDCDAQYGWCADAQYTVNGWNRRVNDGTDK